MHRSSDDSDHSPLPGLLRAQPGEVAARRERPGSAGEHELQQACGTHDRANRFYTQQMNDRLNDQMREFIGRMEMMFIATADAHGECDALFRAGLPGFALVLDDRTLAWPEYRQRRDGQRRQPPREPPRRAAVHRFRPRPDRPARQRFCEPLGLQRLRPPVPGRPGRHRPRAAARTVDRGRGGGGLHPLLQAHPRLAPLPRTRDWGTDDPEKKGGDYFRVAAAHALPSPAPRSAPR